MKIIIAENKFENLILTYLNSKFNPEKINWINPYDSRLDSYDPYRRYFFLGDYDPDVDEIHDYVFNWYDKDYWVRDLDSMQRDAEYWKIFGDTYQKSISNAPILFMNQTDIQELNDFFGTRWEETFKKWFSDNFGLEVKNITSF